ncbi:MAG: FKBP-type peptidyl-prolyl cis-trans isomerase [Candidatus Solibacter usitatus]|nr:FKBP-type peptidyl-prolyl cis-trans isomerase [Candidatus Solibacter usitatus]
MHTLLFLLAPALMAQTPAPTKAAPPKPAAAAKPVVAPKPAAAAKPAVAAKPVAAAKPAAPKPAPLVLKSDEEKIIYALGLTLARNLKPFDMSAAEIDILKRAIGDAAVDKPVLDLSEWGPKVDGLIKTRAERVLVKEKALSKAFLDKAAAEAGAMKTESGIIYRDLTVGTGESPKSSDTVKVHYRGTLVNGTEFDSSYKRNEPASFPLTGVIKCWTEGVQKMKTGGKARLVCPSDMAYGDRGRPSIPGGAALIFEVELLEISAPAK